VRPRRFLKAKDDRTVPGGAEPAWDTFPQDAWRIAAGDSTVPLAGNNENDARALGLRSRHKGPQSQESLFPGHAMQVNDGIRCRLSPSEFLAQAPVERRKRRRRWALGA
jgi:hypothetical protein